MYKWTCPKCNQVFTGGSREALENRADSHLENKHNDTSASVNIEKTNDAAYFPATDKTLADINRANQVVHDGIFTPDNFPGQQRLDQLEVKNEKGQITRAEIEEYRTLQAEAGSWSRHEEMAFRKSGLSMLQWAKLNPTEKQKRVDQYQRENSLGKYER